MRSGPLAVRLSTRGRCALRRRARRRWGPACPAGPAGANWGQGKAGRREARPGGSRQEVSEKKGQEELVGRAERHRVDASGGGDDRDIEASTFDDRRLLSVEIGSQVLLMVRPDSLTRLHRTNDRDDGHGDENQPVTGMATDGAAIGIVA